MSLQKRLDAIREGFRRQASPEILAVMEQATRALQETGIEDSSIGIDDIAPAFQLANSKGDHVSSPDLVGEGPIVLSFHRGRW